MLHRFCSSEFCFCGPAHEENAIEARPDDRGHCVYLLLLVAAGISLGVEGDSQTW